jgi:hypothetical protein
MMLSFIVPFFCSSQMFICSFFARPKNEPKKGGLKSFLGLTFYRLPTHYNSPEASLGVKQ